MELNEALKTSLIKYLAGAEEAIKKGVDLVNEQTPLVVHEIITWNRGRSTVEFLIWFIIFICCVVVVIRSMRAGFKSGNWSRRREFEGHQIVGMVVGTVVGGIAFTAAYNAFLDCMKAWIAPRLLLLETIRDLISKTIN